MNQVLIMALEADVEWMEVGKIRLLLVTVSVKDSDSVNGRCVCETFVAVDDGLELGVDSVGERERERSHSTGTLFDADPSLRKQRLMVSHHLKCTKRCITRHVGW